MKISILTYNVYFNKATKDLPLIASEYSPDILCLQEVETSDEHLDSFHIKNLEMADYSNSFIKHGTVFGLVTFYNKSKLRLISSRSFDIPRSFYEALIIMFRGFNNSRTAIRSEFEHIETKQKVIFYNMHLSPLYASNSTRTKQLLETFKDLQIPEKERVLIAGDFNFPYGRKKLEEITQQYNLEEATNELLFTHENTFFKFFNFKLKLDYIFFKNMKSIHTEKINYRYSDHYPIYAEFQI